MSPSRRTWTWHGAAQEEGGLHTSRDASRAPLAPHHRSLKLQQPYSRRGALPSAEAATAGSSTAANANHLANRMAAASWADQPAGAPKGKVKAESARRSRSFCARPAVRATPPLGALPPHDNPLLSPDFAVTALTHKAATRSKGSTQQNTEGVWGGGGPTKKKRKRWIGFHAGRRLVGGHVVALIAAAHCMLGRQRRRQSNRRQSSNRAAGALQHGHRHIPPAGPRCQASSPSRMWGRRAAP